MTLVFIGYGLIGMVIVGPLAGHFAWAMFRNYCEEYPRISQRRTRPIGAHWIGGTLVAVLVASAWPLVLVWSVSRATLPAVGAEAKERT